MAEEIGRADGRWRIELLGRLQAISADRIITRFPGRLAGLLVAYLAYYRHRCHAREVLIELLWPETSPRVGRNRLNQTLSALRRQLEPPGVPPGTVIFSEREWVGLNPAAVSTDVAEFHDGLHKAAAAPDCDARVRFLTAAVESYRGELISGHQAEWIVAERERLTEAYSTAMRQLLRLLEQSGDPARALDYACRSQQIDPWCEEIQHEIIRLLAASGQRAAALRHYGEWERRLREELGASPAPETLRLIQEIRRTAGGALSSRSPTFCSRSERPCPVADERRPVSPSGAGRPAALSDLSPGHTIVEGRLPLRLTRFFGREAELRELQGLLQPEGDHGRTDRLLTLTGSGGSGKTRLSIELAERVEEAWGGAVWFVPLLDLVDPGLIYDRVLSALGGPGDAEGDPLDRLVAFLRRQPSLLVMDNFEQLVEGGAAELLRLLERTPSLRVVVTSRQRLGIPGEHEFPLRPLPVPTVAEHLIPFSPAGGAEALAGRRRMAGAGDLPHLARNPSVALLLNRAQAVRADFQLTARNAAAVAELCRQLEGLPLALELAAARMSVLTPQQLLDRLSERFRLLQGRSSSADPRHRSLQATLDWSYQLLRPELRRFFALLSVFRGGWTAAAAAAVCEEPEALDCLQQLVEASMVLAADSDADTMRFSLLETVREFGREQLNAEEQAALHERHARHYLEVARQARRLYEEGSQVAALEWMRREADNFRAMLTWGISAEGDPELVLEAATLLFHHWGTTGRWRDGLEYLEAALVRTAAQGETLLRGAAAEQAGRLAHSLGNLALARTHLGEAVRIATVHQDPLRLAEARLSLAGMMLGQGDLADAQTLAASALTLYRELGNTVGQGWAWVCLGSIGSRRGDMEAAERCWEAGLTYARATCDEGAVASILSKLGGPLLARGEVVRARALYEEALTLWQRFGNRMGIADALGSLAGVEEHEGAYDRAAALYAESLALSRELARSDRLIWALTDMAGICRLRGDRAAARAYAEEGLALAQQSGLHWFVRLVEMTLAEIAVEESDAAGARRRYAECLPTWQEMGNRRWILRCLDGLARLAARSGEPERATHLLAAAASLRQSLRLPLPCALRPEYRKTMTVVRRALGEEAFAAAWGEGKAMTPVEAVALALGQVGPSLAPPDPTAAHEGGRCDRPLAFVTGGGDLSDREWARVGPLLPSSEGRRGRPFGEHRRVINGIRWKLRTGAPWRDLPACYGPWRTCHERYQRWQARGLWPQIEQALDEPMAA